MPLADAPAQPAPVHHAQARASSLERGVFRAINRVRRGHGLPRLRMVRPLVGVARLHSADMAGHRTLSHTSTSGTPFHRRIRRAVDARTVGETLIGYRGRMTGAFVVRAWMRSPSHRRQLLSWTYRRVGVGAASPRGYSVVTADFAGR